MNVNHSLDLLFYGLMVVGLNLVALRIAPDFSGAMLTLLVAGGLLVMLFGVLGLRGFCGHASPIVTVTVVAVLVQAAKAWFAMKTGVVGLKPVAVIYFLLLFFAVGQLANLAQSGRQLRFKAGKATDSKTIDAGVDVLRERSSRPVLDE